MVASGDRVRPRLRVAEPLSHRSGVVTLANLDALVGARAHVHLHRRDAGPRAVDTAQRGRRQHTRVANWLSLG